MSIKEVRNDLIAKSPYEAYPDALVTLQLCARVAVLGKQSEKGALRFTARKLLERCPVECDNLRRYLADMSTSMFPHAGLTQIKARVERLHNNLDKRLHRDGVEGWLQ